MVAKPSEVAMLYVLHLKFQNRYSFVRKHHITHVFTFNAYDVPNCVWNNLVDADDVRLCRSTRSTCARCDRRWQSTADGFQLD